MAANNHSTKTEHHQQQNNKNNNNHHHGRGGPRRNNKSFRRRMSDLVSILGCRSNSNIIDGRQQQQQQQGRGGHHDHHGNDDNNKKFNNGDSTDVYKKNGIGVSTSATVVSSSSSTNRDLPPISTVNVVAGGGGDVSARSLLTTMNVPNKDDPVYHDDVVQQESTITTTTASPKEVWNSPRDMLAPVASTALLMDDDDHTNEVEDEEEEMEEEPGAKPLVLRSMPSKDIALSIYDDIDIDRNGWLSIEELDKLSEPIFSKLAHQTSIQKAYQVADKNHDGHLNRHEYEIFIRYIAFYNDAWDVFGINGKHWDRLRKTNFVQKAKALGVTTNDPDKVFSMMNTNRNDHIEYEEYCSWMAKNTCTWNITSSKKTKQDKSNNNNSNNIQEQRSASARSAATSTSSSSQKVTNEESKEDKSPPGTAAAAAENHHCHQSRELDVSTAFTSKQQQQQQATDAAAAAAVAAIENNKQKKALPPPPTTTTTTMSGNRSVSLPSVSKATSQDKKKKIDTSQSSREFKSSTTGSPPVSPPSRPNWGVESKKDMIRPPPSYKPPKFLLENMPTQKEALRVFDELDNNDDSNQILSIMELGKLLKEFMPNPAHKASITRAHHAADENSDGMLRREELEAFIRYAIYYNNAWNAYTSDLEDDAGEHVSKVDKNTFRLVIATRFDLLQQHGDDNNNNNNNNDDDQQIDKLFDEIDDNHSEFITYDEFCTWMARNSCYWHLGEDYYDNVPEPPVLEERSAPTIEEEPVSSSPIFNPPQFLLVNMPTEVEAMRVFDELDDNKNDTLSFFGLGDAIDRLIQMDTNLPITRKAIIARAHHAADENSDGMLRRCEFECFLRYAVYHNNSWDSFIDNDNNNNNNDESNEHHVSKVDKATFQRIIVPKFGLRKENENNNNNDDYYVHLFDEIDQNGSMYITYDEFCTWMARNSLIWKCTTTSK